MPAVSPSSGAPAPPLDLSQPIRIHVVGVGGAGMSAIASVLGDMGHTVTGSDLKRSSATDRLLAAGVEVAVGHQAANVGDVEAVVASTAVSDENPELVEARRRGIAVLSRADMLAAICACRRTIAVSGTHGKTTTTSLLSLVMVEAGTRPSFLVGGDLNEIGTNAVWDDGPWLVVEADESDGTFLRLDPETAVVTNVEPDHLDHYGSFEALVGAFEAFCRDRPGAVVTSADDPVAARIGTDAGAVLVGRSQGAHFRIEQTARSGGGVAVTLRLPDGATTELWLPVAGADIAQNAAMATAAAVTAGAPIEAAARALARFAGVARRYELRGEAKGVRFVDDYAHLPTEVRAVLATASEEERRVVAVFQPHRYSRTAAVGADFAEAFDGADVVVVTDVFAAGETPLPGVTGRLVADAVARARPGKDVSYVAERAELRDHLARVLRPGDLCLTLGAGDLTTLPDELLAAPAW